MNQEAEETLKHTAVSFGSIWPILAHPQIERVAIFMHSM